MAYGYNNGLGFLMNGGKIVDNKMLRGLGTDVNGMTNPAEILAKAGLDWKVVRLPMLIQGKSEQRKSAYSAMVRSDNGVELCAAREYQPIQNHQIVEQFCEFAEAGDLRLRVAGSLDDGRKVFAVADTTGSKGSFELKKDAKKRQADPTWTPGYNSHAGTSTAPTGERGDVTRLQFVISNGHEPGMAFKARAWALREWCANGVTFSEKAACQYIKSHRGKFSRADASAIRNVIENAIKEFETYESKCRRLLGSPMSRIASEAFVLELLQPGLLMQAVDRIPLSSARPVAPIAENDHAAAGARCLEYVVEREARLWDVDAFSRPVNQVLSVLETQPGALEVGETAWNTFNAVTYHVDHVRGRSDESGVDASLFGEGARLKTRALDLAVVYADRLAGMGVNG